MDCALFIRSYWKDLDWLGHCLAAVERYCSDFAETVVVLPERSGAWARRRQWPAFARFEVAPDYDDDYLGQQVSKLHADQWTDCGLICHLDSDCLFQRPTRPSDLLVDGRPRIVTRPNAPLGRHYPWRGCTEAFLGMPVELDFMCRPPFVFPRGLYAELRAYCDERHGVPLDRYVLSRPPRGFSEFNALGTYAWHRHRDAFAFVDIECAGPACCEWFWSWDGVDAMRARIGEILDDG